MAHGTSHATTKMHWQQRRGALNPEVCSSAGAALADPSLKQDRGVQIPVHGAGRMCAATCTRSTSWCCERGRMVHQQNPCSMLHMKPALSLFLIFFFSSSWALQCRLGEKILFNGFQFAGQSDLNNEVLRHIAILCQSRQS